MNSCAPKARDSFLSVLCASVVDIFFSAPPRLRVPILEGNTAMRSSLCVLAMAALLCGAPACSAIAAPVRPDALRDGSHDFDWDIGTWKTHQRRRLHPLTGSTTWVEYSGSDVVRNLWDGANEGIVKAEGPAGHLEIFTLRLYDREAHRWSVYFASRAASTMSPPVVGEFRSGRGEFYDNETYNGKPIMVRFAVSSITADSCHFEQAFSADKGKTWETNFIVAETLVKDAARNARQASQKYYCRRRSGPSMTHNR
jgi:hypothetical protein